MRIGQTSLVVFLSQLLSAALGFVATIYFARVLGPEVYGIYALVVAVVAWLKLFSEAGVGGALTKRLSEGEEVGAYFSAGIMLLVVVGIILSIGVVLAQTAFESYLEEWDTYVTVSVVWFIVGLLLVRIGASAVSRTLQGQRLVHIAGLLDPVKIGLRSLIQIGLVFLGFHLVGMLVGYIVGYALGAILGIYFITLRPTLPGRRHFRSLFDYAKYAWFGKIQGKTYRDVDLLLLGVFVPTALVGVYAIVWSFVQLLKLFGSAVSKSVFPEISHISTAEDNSATASYVEDALSYGGIIVIPGAVGGTLLAERLLELYGPEFVQGTEVFWLVVFGAIFYEYMRQCTTALNGLDRPDLAFRANVVFILANVVLNLLLIPRIGWIGAAVASLLSTAIGMGMAYVLLTRVVAVSFPFFRVSKQVLAASVMGVSIVGIELSLQTTGMVQHNIVILSGLIPLGVAIYLGVLLAISPDFRRIVNRNLPSELTAFRST